MYIHTNKRLDKLLQISIFKEILQCIFSFQLNMAPAQQNVIECPEVMDCQLRVRLTQDRKQEQDGKNCENNNTVREENYSDKINKDFDIAKYEAMEFTPQIRWPDLIVQILLHLVSLFGVYLIITNEVRFYTTLFGKS